MMETRLHAQMKAAPPPSFTPVRVGTLQRKCACGGSAGVAGECDDCSGKHLSLQRSTRNPKPETRNSELGTQNSAGVPPIVHEVLRSPGQPLDAVTRALMEPRFGHDFSRVRVHTGARAAESASAVNALAYTVGRDVVFGAAQKPAALDVDGPAVGQNGMEMIFRIHGAIPAGTEFDITRTKATGVWQQDAGVWLRLGGWPSGTSDDHHDDDECLTPVAGRIFVVDTPGPEGTLDGTGAYPGAGSVVPRATASVWKLTFAEWVIARDRPLGIDWTPI